jgi:hypothetical protein
LFFYVDVHFKRAWHNHQGMMMLVRVAERILRTSALNGVDLGVAMCRPRGHGMPLEVRYNIEMEVYA